MDVLPHWHAYAYTGNRYPYGEVQDGEAPEVYPPEETRDLLDLPAERFVARFEDPEAAAAWLRRELLANPPAETDVHARGTYADASVYSRYRLVDRPELDTGARYHNRRGRWVVRLLVACEQRRLEPWQTPPVCPEGRE